MDKKKQERMDKKKGKRRHKHKLEGENSKHNSNSREERVQMYMDSITDLGKRIFGPDDPEVDEDGCHEMTLREFCSYELDMIENGVSLYISSICFI